MYTPFESGTDSAKRSISGAEEISSSSSRSHFIVAPPIKILPSKAYCTSSFMPSAIVVSSLFFDTTGTEPVFISIKQPVPYVFLTSPLLKQP